MTIRAATLALQWGHGLEAVEDSIGLIQTITADSLQWGHGLEAVEDVVVLALSRLPRG